MSWSRLGTPPDVKFETNLAGERALDELISGDVDLLVDDDVPWRVVRTVLEQLAAVRPEATLGLVVRGDADDPALVRVSVSPARHANSKTRKMSCDGAYERVQSAIEFNFAGELSFADVARIVDCVCTSQDCSNGFSLHYWRPSTSAGNETDQ